MEERPELSLPLPAAHRGTPSPKRMPSGRGGRDRFTAESYTVLGKDGEEREKGFLGRPQRGGLGRQEPHCPRASVGVAPCISPALGGREYLGVSHQCGEPDSMGEWERAGEDRWVSWSVEKLRFGE